jgi:hypothetical protein
MQRHLAAFEALDATPERAVWPLPPRPAGLALAGADATANAHALLARAALSAISLSFIACFLLLVDDANEVLDLSIMPRTAGDPATRRHGRSC